MLENESLVTVTVISYNSEKTILETLKSIGAQTYNKKNIEVIISDDGSRDETISIAKEWKLKNYNDFNDVVIVSHSENKGVAANCNQGWKLAKGKWIKSIAADDLLLPNCIKDNMEFVMANPDANIIFSNMLSFNSNGDNTPIAHDESKICCNQRAQWHHILYECYLLAPAGFINKDVLKIVGYADESYPMIEDYPLWFKCLACGYSFSYLKKNTVLYRRGDSLSQQGAKIGNVAYFHSYYRFQKEKIWPELPLNMFLKKWDDYVLYSQKIIWIKLFGNQVTAPYIFWKKTIFLIRPYRIYCLIKKFLLN
ncbi:glycosyltransferase [Citrobacter freundii]|uniref:glycosyltransferase n=1 Tax=Citrobacter freundii TaxID=546 RepID=UPI001906CEE1|nr:glycosyltransferase [Citrobacter freundii]MBJ9288706.1 glycosyltransferase [Citrobacter freundii]MCR3689338.1 glycosyltransferase [Citrobacter freundii]MDT7310118.1 glycosyltransferase [Citrobacter freundii]